VRASGRLRACSGLLRRVLPVEAVEDRVKRAVHHVEHLVGGRAGVRARARARARARLRVRVRVRAADHVEHLGVMLVEAHLHVEADELAHVPVGEGVLRAEDGSHLEDALEVGHESHLLIELG
jgi:hypothetical protein